MPHHCAAYGCTNNSGKLSCLKKNISFHRFPLRDTNRLQLWVLSIKRKNFVPTQHSVLCSDHFSNRDFEYSGYGIKRTRRLRRDAIPNRYDYTIQGSKCKQSLDAQYVVDFFFFFTFIFVKIILATFFMHLILFIF